MAVLVIAGCQPPVGPVDAGQTPVDAGLLTRGDAGVDGGVDAGVRVVTGACNDGLWSQTNLALDAGGLRVVDAKLIIHGGERLEGPTAVFNEGSLEFDVGDGGAAIIAGDLSFFGHSSLVANAAKIEVAQNAGTSFHLYAADHAHVVFSNSKLVLGSTDNNLWTMLACGESLIELRNLDLTSGAKSTPTPFALDSASVVVENPNDLVELTVNDRAHGTVLNSSAAAVGAYFTVADSVPHDLQLASGFVDGGSTTQLLTEDGGLGARLEVSNSNVFYGLWTQPKTNITLRDSSVGLFLTFDETASVTGLSGGSVAHTAAVGFGDRTLRLINSSTAPVNAYFEPSHAATLSLADSTIGELTCNGPGNTRCVVSHTAIDGSGGFVTVAGNARLDLTNAELNTFLMARDDAVAHLTSVAHRPGVARKPLSITAAGRSVVVLENQNPFVSVTEDGGVVPNFISEEGAVVNAAMYLDPASANDTEFGPAAMKTIYGAASVMTDGGTHRLLHSSLSATNGASTVTFASHATSLPPLSALGVLDTSKLDAGVWVLHLSVDLQSGQAADVMHTIRVTP